MTFRIIETFSGIGSQAKAFERLQKKNPNLDYKVLATVEWEIGAMYAYDIIHHGPQDLSKYAHQSKEEVLSFLEQYNLSSDGKQQLKQSTLKRMSINQLKSIRHSIEANNNLVDISEVHAHQLPEADLLTYSFPCQDLSISSYWHNNFSGIDKNIKNRSGLLWEIERILNEYDVLNKKLPRFLLMENVSAIHGPRHVKNFDSWIKELERLGYKNKHIDLDAFDFGIPQSRRRTFMVSIYTEDLQQNQVNEILNFFNNGFIKKAQKQPLIDEFLRLDYSDPRYLQEALKSTPNKTESRDKIGAGSVPLANGQVPTSNIAKTITTKQDRYPNAGIIFHEYNFGNKKSSYRNLTPRETFLLMGFDELDFQRLVDNNMIVSKSRKMLSHSKLLKLAGNSIVVNILEEIFSELLYLHYSFLEPTTNVLYSKDLSNSTDLISSSVGKPIKQSNR